MDGSGKKVRFKKNIVPRPFAVGIKKKLTIKDMGTVYLAPNEQLTFITENKNRYDVARKNWGFYATPSINSRLKKEGFKTALVRNSLNRIFVMIVEKKRMSIFKKYLSAENCDLLAWLDENYNLKKIKKCLKK